MSKLLTRTGYVPLLHVDIPDDPPWDGSFDGYSMWSYKLWNKFMSAINERRQAVGLIPYGLLEKAEDIIPWNWNVFQSYCAELLIYFAKEWSETPKIEYAHITVIDTDDFSKSGQKFEENLQYAQHGDIITFPNPVFPDDSRHCILTWRDRWWEILKFRRAWPLTIYRLNDHAEGHTGRARFEARPIGSADTDTPEDEAKWSGKYFEGGNGSWTLSEDQDSQPTLLTGTGPCKRGDYIGPWILEDVREIIRRLRYTYSTGSIEVRQVGSNLISTFLIKIKGKKQYNGDGTFSFNNNMFADAVQNGKVSDYDVDQIAAYNAGFDIQGEGTSGVELFSSEGNIKYSFANDLNRKVKSYTFAEQIVANGTDGYIGDTYINLNNDASLGVPPHWQGYYTFNFYQGSENQFFNIEIVEEHGLSFEGKTIGKAALPLPWSPFAQWYIDNNKFSISISVSSAEYGWGYQITTLFAIADWYVAGGFKYT